VLKTAFDLKSSAYLTTLLVLLHAGAILFLCLLSLSIGLIIGAACLAAVSLLFTLRRHALRLEKAAIIRIHRISEDCWHLYDRADRCWQAELSNKSLRSLPLILLNFKIPGRRFMLPVLIVRDTLAHDDFRRLSVLLLM